MMSQIETIKKDFLSEIERVADTSDLEVVIGNKVKIAETRPISKDKYFKVIEIITEKHVKKSTRKVEVVEKVKTKKVAAKKGAKKL
mgnify:CR=1 FL=1